MFEELLISIPVLILSLNLLMWINPRYCSRCSYGTFFPKIQHLHNNPNFPLQKYCLKCFFYINLSEWKCKCGNSGTHRIHDQNFISRLRIIKGKKNVYKKCTCGNVVELVQK